MTFNQIAFAPADPILGLTEAYRNDPRTPKVNLGVGVFVDDRGVTPVLECVRRAERIYWELETSKGYIPIAGTSDYAAAVSDLVFGAGYHCLAAGSVAVVQTPGGTGALRIGAEFINAFRGGGTVWIPQPTWGNHKSVFDAAGVAV
ncbi:MAG: aminotransferase class I/II-fold pyridoxal phosphate-dependent enzyme, partial [Verrucomicrobiota bacterium]|nr:aminotransferase class I/II-fold pyridoxal phosphate-dependent enzyme [Verrucomicrobiota bacterium]